jgi:multisubunit Na+/H+ antiporter MnhF subunit
MKNLVKYLGVLSVVIGALVIIIPALMDATSNITLGIAAVFLVLGLVGHIVISKYLK